MSKCQKTRKTKYRNRKSAERGILFIWGNDPSVKLGDLHTYVCPFCGAIHIGHVKKGKR